MPRLSINEMTTFRWSFDEDVLHYREMGIPAIGVWRRKLSDFGEERGIELLGESGLAVSNLHWAGGFTGSEGHTYRESIDDALEAVRVAGAMQAHCLVVCSGARAGHTHNHARRLLIGALKELAPVAKECGVILALEPMHPNCASEWSFITSLEDAAALLDQVGSSQVQLAFDTYHLGADPAAIEHVRRLAPQIAIVHLADGVPPDEEQHRTRLGKGKIPLKPLIAALLEGGYDGDFDVELFGDEIAPNDYENLLRETKETFAQLVSS